jgi:hypothetical protein
VGKVAASLAAVGRDVTGRSFGLQVNPPLQAR